LRHNMPAQVLAASMRGPLHVTQAALAGAHIATIPSKCSDRWFTIRLRTRASCSFARIGTRPRPPLAATGVKHRARTVTTDPACAATRRHCGSI
jgi:hypothetical protein